MPPTSRLIYVFGDSLSDVGNVSLATGGRSSRPALMSAANSATGRSGCRTCWEARPSGAHAEPGRRQRLRLRRRDDRIRLHEQFGRPQSGATGRHVPFGPRPARLRTPSTPSRSAPMISSLSSADETGGLTPAQAAGAAAQVVATEAAALAAAGAKNLVLFDVPDLGLTPEITALGPARLRSGHRPFSIFRSGGAARPCAGRGRRAYGLRSRTPYALIDEAVQNPGEFGFSNVTDPCWTGGFTGGRRLALFHGPRGAGHATFSGTTSIRPPPGIFSLRTLRSAPWACPCPSPRPGRCCSSALADWVLRAIARGLARRREAIGVRTQGGRLGAAFLFERHESLRKIETVLQSSP